MISARHAAIALVLSVSCALFGADKPQDKPAAVKNVPPAKAANAISVAVLDFESSTAGSADLGKQIGEVVAATLSGQKGITLVDRSVMARALSEQELNLTGLIAPEQAVKVGKLIGAKLLVTGKAFTLDRQILITAKIIGTETSLVEGVVVKGDKNADMSVLVLDLSEKVANKLRESGAKLVAKEDSAADPVPALAARLKKLKLPKVAVNVAERHVTHTSGRANDPPVDSEIKLLMNQCGFTVVDGDEKRQAEEGVEVVISGEAFSEFGARIGNLVSCSGRVEVKATVRKDGTVLFADRATTRAVDLSEQIAGKTALQKGGRELGLKLLSYFAENLPAKGE